MQVNICVHRFRFSTVRVSSRLELRKHSFSQRIVDHWNKLPDDVVSAATISTFKRRLDIWMDRCGHQCHKTPHCAHRRV